MTDARRIVPCIGGPCDGYPVLVTEPLPLELERDPVGIYVLDPDGTAAVPGPVYVYLPERFS